MTKLVDKLFPKAKELKDAGKCPTCWKVVGEFRNDAFRKEFAISGMCQECQDSLEAETAQRMLEWLVWCERYLRHPDVREVTRHFSIPPNLIALNQLINDAKGEGKVQV